MFPLHEIESDDLLVPVIEVLHKLLQLINDKPGAEHRGKGQLVIALCLDIYDGW